MNTMYIGSGDVTALMSKKDSQSHLSYGLPEKSLLFLQYLL